MFHQLLWLPEIISGDLEWLIRSQWGNLTLAINFVPCAVHGYNNNALQAGQTCKPLWESKSPRKALGFGFFASLEVCEGKASICSGSLQMSVGELNLQTIVGKC